MKPERRDAGARKGARTRLRIVRAAADLFNVRGFAGTSVNDVSFATGLEKGGVYNHFASKDDLALAAFDYAATLVHDRLRDAVRAQPDGIAGLRAIFAVYRSVGEQPFVAGGCPLLNTAVDADDTHPALRERVRAAMSSWLLLVTDCLMAGCAGGELRADIDHRAVASAVVAALEGGVLLARLYADPTPMRGVIDQLSAYLDTLRVVPA